MSDKQIKWELIKPGDPSRVWEVYTGESMPVEAEYYNRMMAERNTAIKRAERAEAERDGFQFWASTLESCAWQDAGFCPHCGEDNVRVSTDVLEPDVALAVHYCCSCQQAWLDAPTHARA